MLLRLLRTPRPHGWSAVRWCLVDVRLCQSLRPRIQPEYVGLPHSKLHNVVWRSHLQNIYVVKKPWNPLVRDAMVQFVSHVNEHYPAVNIIVSEDVADELAHEMKAKCVLFTGSIADIVERTDLIVTLGGDGTILRAVSAFSNTNVPPVVSFALGTLGFLLPFDFTKFKETFRLVYESRSKALHRNRLECHVVRKNEGRIHPDLDIIQYELDHYKQNHTDMVHAMNDITLHRGSQPNLILLDIFIDNEFLTTTTADGIAFLTPTGLTAYSLSAGGSITHPLVPCILLTPVCPRSLSFRPLILPSTSHIMIQLSESNRNVAIKLNIDGIPQQDLKPGDQIHVVSENGTIFVPGKHDPPASLKLRNEYNKFIEPGSNSSNITELKNRGIWCVARSENDWTKDINNLLGFNSSFSAKKQQTSDNE